jgi:mitochondrial fission protein ELM1
MNMVPVAETLGRGPYTCWVLSDGTAGMEKQCLALAAALPASSTVFRLSPPAPWRWLPPILVPPRRSLLPAGPPWPDLAIATGRLSVASALALGRASGRRTLLVQVQNPRVPLGRFDLVIGPRHDWLAGPNVLTTLGALTGVTSAGLDAARAAAPAEVLSLAHPLLAVLLGGPNRAYRFPSEAGDRLASSLVRLAGDGWSILAVPSRRTPAEIVARLRCRLHGLPAVVWDGTGANPYEASLALADAFLVTSDSINMASEAAATGKPLHIFDLPGGAPKFRRFHAFLREAGCARPFRGAIEHWSYDPPDDTRRAAAEILRRLAARGLQ